MVSCFMKKIKSVLIGVLFYPNPEGDVVDMQADIIGPGKHYTLIHFELY